MSPAPTQVEPSDYGSPDENLRRLQERLAIRMKRPQWLLVALTHSSYANERRDLKIEDNERLEFLGDAVLQLGVSDYLFKRFPDLPEGDLTRIRAVVVCEASLAEKARELGLGEHMYLGRGEEASSGRTRRSLLADAFEAVIGAYYLDRGLMASKDLVLRLLGPAIEAAGTGGQPSDYKTALQEQMQKDGSGLTYQLLGDSGPDHAKVFTVGVTLRGRVLARGRGTSKKEAEQVAARKALEKVQRKSATRRRAKAALPAEPKEPPIPERPMAPMAQVAAVAGPAIAPGTVAAATPLPRL